MKNGETGEFELVLGNKQLLSGFFIVVILFGVFFTMGYIVGRSSSPAQRVPAAAPAAPEANADGAASPVIPPAQPGGPAAETPAPAQAPAPEDASHREPAAPAAQTEAPKTPAPAPQAPAAAAESTAGEIYLQVMAVKRPEAEVVVKALRDKGFRASMGPGPNDLVRVLVGPFADGASLGTAKANLENAGFHPIVRK
jgi:cell division septation protein DedD